VRHAQRAIFARVDREPTGFYRNELDGLLEAARVEVAGFCGATPDGFAFVRNATEGMNCAISALGLGRGDEIVVLSCRYPSIRLALDRYSARVGCVQSEVTIGSGATDEEIANAIANRVTARTRAVVLDQIASPTGRILPIGRVSSLLGGSDAILVIDGAHAPGSLHIPISELSVDVWTGNFHKWTCAPQGSAGIWASPRVRDRLRPSAIAYRDLLAYPQCFGRLGTDDLTPYLCTPVALRLLGGLGHERVASHNFELAARGAALVADRLGTELPSGTYCGRHAVRLPTGIGVDDLGALELQDRIFRGLRAQVVVSPAQPGDSAGTLALSAFLYNHEGEFGEFSVELGKLLN
jgi:isopenicillin-N epimerase